MVKKECSNHFLDLKITDSDIKVAEKTWTNQTKNDKSHHFETIGKYI